MATTIHQCWAVRPDRQSVITAQATIQIAFSTLHYAASQASQAPRAPAIGHVQSVNPGPPSLIPDVQPWHIQSADMVFCTLVAADTGSCKYSDMLFHTKNLHAEVTWHIQSADMVVCTLVAADTGSYSIQNKRHANPHQASHLHTGSCAHWCCRPHDSP